jgi:hypothetical protein
VDYRGTTNSPHTGGQSTARFSYDGLFGSAATAGVDTTASIVAQGKSETWEGAGMGDPTPPPATQETMSGLSGAAISLAYSVAPGTTLFYEYTIF